MKRVVIAVACCALAAAGAAHAQDAPPKDTIFARKIVMDTIKNNMDELEGMIASGKEIELKEAREHADTISVLLMAFPHLFPPATNQWKPDVARDPGTDTYAAPTLWTPFADFYRQATDASKTAYRASRAKTEGDFKGFVAALRSACDGCHAAYLKGE
jgi:cytochrome c556